MSALLKLQQDEETILDREVLNYIRANPGLERKTLDIYVAMLITRQLQKMTGLDHEVIVQLSLGRLTAHRKIFTKPGMLHIFTQGRVYAATNETIVPKQNIEQNVRQLAIALI